MTLTVVAYNAICTSLEAAVATISVLVWASLTPPKITHPAAFQGSAVCYQLLTRTINNLRICRWEANFACEIGPALGPRS